MFYSLFQTKKKKLLIKYQLYCCMKIISIWTSLNFYAPVLKDLGHIVLPFSVCPSICPSVHLSVCLHKINMKT